MEAAGGAGAPPDAPSSLLYSVTLEGDKFIRKEKVPSTFTFEDGTSFHDYILSDSFKSIPINQFGSFSNVYKVDDKYIIKHIFNRSDDNPYERNNAGYEPAVVNKEISGLIALHKSPYVVKLLAAEAYEHEAFLLYPNIPGETLFEWLAKGHDISEKERVKSELTAGLKDIHEAGLLHRDIKIDNIFIPFDSNIPAFYLDFGLVVAIDSEQPSKGVKALQEKNFSIKPQTINRNIDPLSVILQRIDWSADAANPAAAAEDVAAAAAAVASGKRPPSPNFSPYGGVRRTRRRLEPGRNRTRGQRKRMANSRTQRGRSRAGRG
jgi:serine/threonine protein kinase